MKKNIIFFCIILVVIAGAIFVAYHRMVPEAQRVLRKVQRHERKILATSRLVQMAKQKIGLVIQTDVYDTNQKLIEKRKMQVLPGRGKARVDVKDLQENHQYAYVISREKRWCSEPFVPVDIRIYSFMRVALGRYPQFTVEESECGISKVGKKKCFFITIMGNLNSLTMGKIKGYFRYPRGQRQFEWVKLEIFLLRDGNWFLEKEIYPEQTVDLEGIKIPSRSLVYSYFSNGKKVTTREIVASAEEDRNIDETIFTIP
ncbi:MAG: hypothetical protein KKH94_12620 [Candidatus Omnitrophica bacterium]|nr:hypothetical protein [Candidatus Omnitrophota bacterium]